MAEKYMRHVDPVFAGLFVLTISFATFASLVDPSRIDLGFSVWDKLMHTATYCILAFLLARSFKPAAMLKIPPIQHSVFLFGYGILIECLQALTPLREPSVLDVVANATGIGIYSLMHLIIRTGYPPSGTA